MGSPVRVAVLAWSDILAEYALFLLMTYLTDVWKLKFRQSAAIINTFCGMAAIMPIAMKFIIIKFINSNYGKSEKLKNGSDAQKLKDKEVMIDRWLVLLSSIAYSAGLGLLTLSAPEMVSGKRNTWNAYYTSVGADQKTLFYFSLPLIAVAKSGFTTSLKKVLAQGNGSLFTAGLSTGASALCYIFGLAISYVIMDWLRRFGIPALCMAVATLIYSTFLCSPNPRQGCLSRVFDCIKNKFRCGGDKEEDKETTTEETRFIISLIPMCSLGLVNSLGLTFFLEQAFTMDHKMVGSLKVPLGVLLGFYNFARILFPKLCFGVFDCFPCKTYLNRVGTALSLLCALLCCVVAAKVESRRLDVVRSHGLLHSQSHEPVPMSILYLVPQFLLLGGFFGMADESTRRFFNDCKIPTRMEPYMVDSATGLFGLGNIGSVLLVYLVHYITSRGDRNSWFTETINTSRLDNYYWALSVWIAVNLVWYILVAHRNPPKNKDKGCVSKLTSCLPSCCCCLCIGGKNPNLRHLT